LRRASRPVACKPTWWRPTFASRRTRASSDPCKPSRALPRTQGETRSQRLSGEAACQGQVARIVRSACDAL
ncbi:hypothetical protein K466DRAFT_481193, partial [Polyporus arcularius HHB13444]